LTFGTGIEKCEMSGGGLSYLYTEQDKPKPVENKVLVLAIFRCEKH